MNRYWTRHEQGRARNPDGTTSVFCAKCGREIMRQTHPTIRSVSKCQICVLKAQGVVNAEDYVLAQYRLSNTPGGPPVPIDIDDSIASGVLLLYPEEAMKAGEQIPQIGIIGTIKQAFRTLGFMQEKPVAPTPSRQLASAKRTGLFGPNKSKSL